MKPFDPRRLERLLAVRQAAARRAERALASALAAERSAAMAEARVLRAFRATSARSGALELHDLAARATLSALLEPALAHARDRVAAGKAGVQAALGAVAVSRVARDTVEARLAEARMARLEAAEERISREIPARGKMSR